MEKLHEYSGTRNGQSELVSLYSDNSNTPIDRANIVNILEDLALSLCSVDANLRMILLADDREVVVFNEERPPAKRGTRDERGSD